jgi:hypothetical protein
LILPYCVQTLFQEDGGIATAFFYKEGEEFLVNVQPSEGRTIVLQDRWPNIFEASRQAKLLVQGLATGLGEEDPLKVYKDRGDTLLVTIDNTDGKYAVVTINKRAKRYEDTGVRFQSEEEARGYLTR